MSTLVRISFWTIATVAFLAGCLLIGMIAGLLFSDPEVAMLASFVGGLLWGPVAVTLGFLVHERLGQRAGED